MYRWIGHAHRDKKVPFYLYGHAKLKLCLKKESNIFNKLNLRYPYAVTPDLFQLKR